MNIKEWYNEVITLLYEGIEMKEKIKLKGRLRSYMQWPMYMLLFFAIMNIWVFTADKNAGIIMLAGVAIYGVAVVLLYLKSKNTILEDMVNFADQYGMLQNEMMKELNVPYVVLQDDGKILWANSEFKGLIGVRKGKDTYLSKYIPELNRGIFPKEEDTVTSMEVSYNERDFRVEMRCISLKGFNEAENILKLPPERAHILAIQFYETTEINEYIRQLDEQRLVAGLLYIDNYEEVMQSVEEVRQSLLAALIERKITQTIMNRNGIVKKLEKDKFIVVLSKVEFEQIIKEKFPLLEVVKGINVGNKVPATLSMGFGLSKDTYATGYNYARVAIDLALARGGDQVAVKSVDGITYYGGKSEKMSKNTRVKARVKAEALREFMEHKERVIVMGHKIPDVDCFGAAIGIACAAKSMDKKVHIVINDLSASLRPVYEAFKNSDCCSDDLFINSREAEELAAEDDSMVVVVDTNKPRMTECENLLKLSKLTVVLDHHRQSEDVIENATLSYIEPYASSACEMVAEVLQYFSDDLELDNMEANCLYAGIIIDTNNFMTRAGVRTFEAAAYLRRCGADITYVRKVLRDDIDAYRAKSAILSSTEIYHKMYAIASGDNLRVESPTIVGAQAANELLNIDGVKGSFVLTVFNGKIYVSARAIDEVNVQIIMERLGGGGHINAAGAQINHTDLDKAIDTLKELIDVMIEEGEI